MKVLYVFADTPREWNCSQFDCIDPKNAINKTRTHTADAIFIDDFIRNEPETQKRVEQVDIVIIERNLFQDALTMLMWWKVRGAQIGLIWDDGYPVIHPKNPAYPFWQHGEMRLANEKGEEFTAYMNPKPLQQLGWALRESKGLQTVSQAIADQWSHLTDTYLIHNHLVIDRYIDVQPLHTHDKNEIWIGWTGSLSHVDSFESSGLLRAYRKVLKKFPNVKVLISGDKKIFDNLDVPANKKMFSGFVPAEQYPGLIKSLDICTIPLYGDYDKCRSQIKPLECLALKVPFIATNFPNYNHLNPYGTFTENGWQNWENAITYAIENLPKYQEKSNEVGYPFALTQDIDLHVDERIAVYQKMIDKPYGDWRKPENKEEEWII